MKTIIMIVVIFLIGGYCFFELPKFEKTKLNVKITSNEVILQKNKLNNLISKIEVEQKEVEVILDSIQ